MQQFTLTGFADEIAGDLTAQIEGLQKLDIHFMEMRTCSRAYKEIRQISAEIKKLFSGYSDEWKWVVDNFFVPSCKTRGYCIEAKCCGAAPKGLKGLKEKNIIDFVKYLSENTTVDTTTIKEVIPDFLEESK